MDDDRGGTNAPEEAEPTCTTCDDGRYVTDGDDRQTRCPDCGGES